MRVGPVMQLTPLKEEEGVMKTLREGIKNVAVGVKGSKPIPDELAPELISIITTASGGGAAAWGSEVEQQKARERLASFLGTLFVKQAIVGADEVVLAHVASCNPGLAGTGLVRGGCSSAQLLAVAVPGKASPGFTALLSKLLDGKTLSREEAEELGGFFFDAGEPVEGKVLGAHLLRVRYETMDEWVGLLRAQQATVDPALWDTAAGRAGGKRIVQIADPFDGTHKAESFVPLIASHIQKKWGAVAVSVCSPSSGPKWGPNLHALGKELSPAAFATSSAQVMGEEKPAYGWFVDQETASGALARWIPVRRNVIKRPFFATSEKFLDTCGAEVLVASAFHPTFSDKMFEMAEKASAFKAVVVVRRGCEGSLGFSLARPAQVTVGMRQSDGSFKRTDFQFGPEEAGLTRRLEVEQQCAPLSAESTAAKIARFEAEGSSGDAIFDDRVELTLAGLDKAFAQIFA